MVVVKNHIVLSEMKEIHKPEELRKMIQSVIKQGLEGLVLKDINVSALIYSLFSF